MTPSTVPTSKVLYFPSAEISNFLNFWIPSHLLSSKTLCSVRWKRVKTCFSIAEAPRDSINGALLTPSQPGHHIYPQASPNDAFFHSNPKSTSILYSIHWPVAIPSKCMHLNKETLSVNWHGLKKVRWTNYQDFALEEKSLDACACAQGTACPLNWAGDKNCSKQLGICGNNWADADRKQTRNYQLGSQCTDQFSTVCCYFLCSTHCGFDLGVLVSQWHCRTLRPRCFET